MSASASVSPAIVTSGTPHACFTATMIFSGGTPAVSSSRTSSRTAALTSSAEPLPSVARSNALRRSVSCLVIPHWFAIHNYQCFGGEFPLLSWPAGLVRPDRFDHDDRKAPRQHRGSAPRIRRGGLGGDRAELRDRDVDTVRRGIDAHGAAALAGLHALDDVVLAGAILVNDCQRPVGIRGVNVSTARVPAGAVDALTDR